MCVAPMLSPWLWPVAIIGAVILALFFVLSLPLLVIGLVGIIVAVVLTIVVAIALPLLLAVLVPVLMLAAGCTMLWQCFTKTTP